MQEVRERGVKDAATVFCLSQWKEGVAICCHGEDCGRCKCGGEDLKFTFGQIKLEICQTFKQSCRRGRGIYEAKVQGRDLGWKYTFGKHQHIVGI